MVEGAALEMLCRGNSTEGSNPSLSAIFFAKKNVGRQVFKRSLTSLFLFTKMNPLWFDDEVEHERSESNPSLSAILRSEFDRKDNFRAKDGGLRSFSEGGY